MCNPLHSLRPRAYCTVLVRRIAAVMPWQREAEFKEVLEKAVKKGSKGAIATTQAIALQDMAQVQSSRAAKHNKREPDLSFCPNSALVLQCYKHVCALVERQMRKAKPAQRLNALYIISTICRHSLRKNKLQDKYSTHCCIFLFLTSSLFNSICVCASWCALQLSDGDQTLQTWSSSWQTFQIKQ